MLDPFHPVRLAHDAAVRIVGAVERLCVVAKEQRADPLAVRMFPADLNLFCQTMNKEGPRVVPAIDDLMRGAVVFRDCCGTSGHHVVWEFAKEEIGKARVIVGSKLDRSKKEERALILPWRPEKGVFTIAEDEAMWRASGELMQRWIDGPTRLDFLVLLVELEMDVEMYTKGNHGKA